MSLHYILDGYNIIKNSHFRKIKNLKDQRLGFIKMLKENKRLGKKTNITVVFDGKKEIDFTYPKDETIEIIFTRDETADDWIKRKIKNLKDKKELIVVTDDKEIALFVRACSVSHMGVKEFFKKLLPKEFNHDELIKPELSYTEVVKINEELRKVWLDK
jgi:predicted RNA-binding protein with PIN domain